MASSYELGAQLKNFVDNLVAAGRYNSGSEVVCDGLRFLQWRSENNVLAIRRDIRIARP